MEYIHGFYDDKNDNSLEEQLYDINRVCTILPTTGFDKKENLKGITPQMISLFLSVVESMDMHTVRIERIKAVSEYVDEHIDEYRKNPNHPKNILMKKIIPMLQRKTTDSFDSVYNLIKNKVDIENYTKFAIDNHFESYFANVELAYVTSCASLYNAIIRTEFYEKVLKRDEEKGYVKLEEEIYKELMNLDMDEFEINASGSFKPCKGYGEKMNALAYIRNVLLHGGAEIDYSTLKGNIEDIRVKFKLENSNFIVVASVGNIMKLANEKVLYKKINVKNNKKGKKGN